MIKEKFLAKPKFRIIEYESSMPPLAERYKELYEEIIMENEERNKAIVETAYKLAKQGHRVLIDVKRIEHGKILVEMLKQRGINAEFLSSKSPNRWKILEKFKMERD